MSMPLPSAEQVLQMLPRQPLVLPIGVVLFLLWLASVFRLTSVWIFILAFAFLYQADMNYITRIRRQVRSEERRSASQRLPLSDLESAQWLNQVIQKIWPHFLEEFVSQQLLKALIPWFLDKYKPWTIRQATLRHLYLGRSPPMFTGVRTLERSNDDDHLVMDMCLDFLAAEDMDAILAVQMRRRLGFGLWTNIHISRLQIEGKVRIGVRFSNEWPFLSRVRICFENPPYVQMTARPLSTHGMNVSELPLVAGWMEKMVADVFEQSLVEPNMLVLDVEKLMACMRTSETPRLSPDGDWFQVQERSPAANVHLEILEAMDLKPSDLNGLADPFVKGSFATCHFKTKVWKKTLNPKWQEEFKIPIASWDLPALLVLHVRDKDQFRDDDLGFCELDLADYRGGQRHDIWMPLKDVKMGRLHIALKVIEKVNSQKDPGSVKQGLHPESSQSSLPRDDATHLASEQSLNDDKFETINLGKGDEGGFVSIMRPGKPVSKKWQQRQGVQRHDELITEKETLETMNMGSESSSSSEEEEAERNTKPKKKRWQWRLSPTSPRDQKELPAEVLAVGNKGTTVRMKLEHSSGDIGRHQGDSTGHKKEHDPFSATDHDSPQTPTKRTHMKNMAKGMVKQAEKTAHNVSHALSRKGSHNSEKGREQPKGDPADNDMPVNHVEEPKVLEM